ncbi:hypothetical protein C2E23DRAFT_787519 [Lenzites betulinus]|nr:hypothetical protein C2E23DRAFT_787519 [Lenzites betulinus]
MHLFGLNIPDLFYRHWHGSFECDTRNGDSKVSWDWVCLLGETWAKHGEQVASARQFLPGSFDRPPRNPAEKISSGYKCWEFLNWFYGMAPGFLYGILPEQYWKHYCKLVAAVRIVFQRRSSAAQRTRAHILLSDFAHDYEVLYVRRKVSRIHFVPQCMHSITHAPTETCRVGSLICTCQFAMERIIGDLGAEIRQPLNPFANLSQRALRRARVNALTTMLPDLDNATMPTSSKVPLVDMGDNYTLLHPREPRSHPVGDDEDIVILRYIEDCVGPVHACACWVDNMRSCVQRWARCRLPNGQICRSAWKEVANGMTQTARNVRVSSLYYLQQVQYYFRCTFGGQLQTLALISKYGPLDQTLLQLSSGVVWAAQLPEPPCRQLEVIDIKGIVATVAMIPCNSLPCAMSSVCKGQVYFAMDKLGVDIDDIVGALERRVYISCCNILGVINSGSCNFGGLRPNRRRVAQPLTRETRAPICSCSHGEVGVYCSCSHEKNTQPAELNTGPAAKAYK